MIGELSKDIEFKMLMSSLDVSVSKHLLDEHFTLVAANDRYYKMFGYSRKEYEDIFHNRPDLFYLNAQEDWQKLVNIVVDTIEKGKNKYECICRMPHKDGRHLWIKLVGNFTDEYIDGYRVSYSVMMDITDLMTTKTEKNVIWENFPGCVAKYRITQKGLQFLEGNQNFHGFFTERLSLGCDELNAKNGLENVCFDCLRQGQSTSCTITPPDSRGGRYTMQVYAQCIDWIQDDPIYLLIYNDITLIMKQNQQLEDYNQALHKLAYSDELTGGFNRRKFEQTVQEYLQKSVPYQYQIIWFNIQKFKLINDVGGVEAGDRTLCYVHNKILSHLHENECLTRLYSDNFVIFMENHDDTEIRLNQIVDDINGYNHIAKYKYYLTFTAGIYIIDDCYIPITYMEDWAHLACQNHKVHKGTDMCIIQYYHDNIRLQMRNEQDLENKMRDALKNGEFEVYLQPKYSLKQQRIAGAEALIRWNDPQNGMVPPSEFIPLFETNGFIVQLDLFVFQKVCQLLAKWMKNNQKIVPISVNMSRIHFRNSKFLKEYIKLKREYRIPDGYIEIELTESVVFEDLQMFKNIIHELHCAGFTCSLDDFGSGYSTLNTLKNLDVDTLKIDKAFFSSENMINHKENIIVKSIVDMAKNLEMKTVAEGIETKQQMQFLNQTSCDLVQGFIFSKPLSISAFEKLLYQK